MLAVNERLPYLREKTSKLTSLPGCYIMKDESGRIIYIGKAKNLRNRVSSYFRKEADHLPKVAKMVSNVFDYDFIVTDSEFEALVLECSLIKQYKPKYNILLKDDKGYSYIKVTGGDYPRLQCALQKEDDGSQYIGPFTSSYAVKQAVAEANRVFMLPTCCKRFPNDINKQRPCLNYHIKLCMGVCRGCISKEEYGEIIRQAVEFIKNGSEQSVKRMTDEMNRAAEQLEFEKAAVLRDRINAIVKASESQKIIDEDRSDCDVIAAAQANSDACVSVLMFRGGRLFDKASYFFKEQDNTSSLREEFIAQYYSSKDNIPKKILVDTDLDGKDELSKLLRLKSGSSVTITSPKKGEQLRLIELSRSNASEYLSLKVGRTGKEIVALDELAKVLGLAKPPVLIECYDISNLGETNIVAGMVVFENGRPCKRLYRKFSIKQTAGQNDYACMEEVVTRRFTHMLEGDESFSFKPDLILLDGGKGHVNTIAPVLRSLGLDIPLFGLVKDSRHRTRAVATGGGEISLSKSSAAFSLIAAIQDEVHRFAVTYQRQKRVKAAYTLQLTQVKGIGNAKAKLLLDRYKTKAALKDAQVQELAETAKISIQTAQELKTVIDDM